jgi:hypothetical protein
MSFVRIKAVQPLTGHRLRLTLSNGAVVERDVSQYLVGPVFDAIRSDPAVFAQVYVDHGTVVWPGDVDLCPDVLISGESPPAKGGCGIVTPAQLLEIESQRPGPTKSSGHCSSTGLPFQTGGSPPRVCHQSTSRHHRRVSCAR